MLATALPALDWPEPVEILNAGSDTELVLICDHASNHVPTEYDRLGVGEADLQRHIAWDVGAAALPGRSPGGSARRPSSAPIRGCWST